MDNQTEKNEEHEMETQGPVKRVYKDITPITEKQMDNKMEHEMETGIV